MGTTTRTPNCCKITLRGKAAQELIPRLLSAKDNVLKACNFDGAGNISFGIPEYIDIEGAKYDPEIGIIGLQACITLSRPGYRVKKRRLRQASISKKHVITSEESITFMKDQFKTKLATGGRRMTHSNHTKVLKQLAGKPGKACKVQETQCTKGTQVWESCKTVSHQRS